MDVDKDGVTKKLHYHVILIADGPITQERADEIFTPLGGTKSAEYVKSLKGYVRYLAHLDDLDKAQYDPSEIVALGGADLADVLKPSRSDRYHYIGEIMDYCEENGVVEFADLLRHARKERQDDWFPIIVDSAYFMHQYITSHRFSLRDREKSVHYKTGKPRLKRFIKKSNL
jgi:hypothetical protein